MAIARVTVLDFTDEESKKVIFTYMSNAERSFPNMHMNMIISTGPTSFLSISVYENDKEAEANMEARTKLHGDANIKDDFYKGDIQMFFQSDKFPKPKIEKIRLKGKPCSEHFFIIYMIFFALPSWEVICKTQ